MTRLPLQTLALAALVALPTAARAATAPQPADQPILLFLNQAIAWYRQQAAVAQLATEPADVVFVDAVRQQAREALQLAFAFARADAALEPGQATAAPTGGAAASLDAQSLARMATDAASAVERAQARVDALQRRLGAVAERQRTFVAEQLAAARGELQLAQARRQTLQALVDFVNQAGSAGTVGGGVLGHIEELERSVPEAEAPRAPSTTSAGPAATARRAAPTGIVALASDLLTLGRKMRALHDGVKLTTDLRARLDKVRAPLIGELRATVQRADQLSRAAASTDVLRQRASELDQLTSRFKQVSAAVVPAGKLALLLDAHRATLNEWHGAADDQYDTVLRALALHLGLVAIAIAAILAASAFWRRATFRYVRDLRRRQQSLLARRIVVAVAIVLMIAFSFVTELGSLATFAGFITAGLAVALQNVILSVAAYFFLIGKFGIRVGDRVQISGVSGDVMEIGLVRLHLMELRPDGLPTGRVVVFSNSVLFQPTANFFKQIPGSSFTWHQVTLTLSPGTDYGHAEQRLLEAVEKVYARYRDAIARQHEEMSQNLSIRVHEPRPQSQLHLTEAGLVMTIRFPVPLDNAAAVDDQVTRALLDAIDREPRLKLSGSGTPTIQAVPEPASA